MKTSNGESVLRGVCPACLKSIDRKDLKVAKAFKCPHCQQFVRTSTRFRLFLYLACYGVPTVIVLYSHRTLLADVVLWLILEFLFGMLYIFIATTICAPRLELFRKKEDDFQSLDLTK